MSTSFFETRAYNGSIKNVVQFRKMRKENQIFAGPAQSNSIIPIYFVYLIWFRSAARHFFHQPQQANHHHFGWVLKWPWINTFFLLGKCDWGGAHMKLFLFVNLVKSQLIEISHCQPQKLPNAPNKWDIAFSLSRISIGCVFI